jgi:centromere/kinetochore protein ZW10
MATIGVDDAERIARVLTDVEGLSDLFIKPADPPPSRSNPSSPLRTRLNPIKRQRSKEGGVHLTPLFVPLWFRLNFLNQVLQSNLVEIRYLWFESDLSLYFGKEEVLELIRLSFEMNANVRGVVKEIEKSAVGKGTRTGV